ncbi:solute carrier family 22 member 4-like [Mya arenaria]|uniref:solute carrier family 22 member 4-like n=1 Tax=Mya arenaria TaxID=6604 RepID=UPI0022E4F821|nr:solute carrier family 22 member 4-like [Mya arenaria]
MGESSETSSAPETETFLHENQRSFDVSNDAVTHDNKKSGKPAGDSDDDLTPDDILLQLGGCGLFQILLALIIQSMKTVICWGIGGNSFFAYVPKWRCTDVDDVMNISSTVSPLTTMAINVTDTTNTTAYWNQQCQLPNGTHCSNFEFESSMHTLVSEFDLVCSQSWVTATITSVQMVGMMVGSFVVGHLADMFGRKKPFVLSMAIICLSTIICYFSVHWIMFATARFFFGIGASFFMSIYCILQGEHMLSKWRSTTISFPSWALELNLFSLVVFLLHDWEHVTLIMAFLAAIYLLTWFFIPESFRWLVARNKIKEARLVVNQMAKWNKRPVVNFERMVRSVEKSLSGDEDAKYSVIVLFRKRPLLRLTVPLMLSWLTLGVIGYGVGFGVKEFSGNFYLNLFLFALASIPFKLISIYLQVRIGRKFTSIIAYIVCLVGGLVVTLVQYIDTPYRGGLTTGFALMATAGVGAAWGPMQTMTVELYPTVARNTAFGFLSVLARLGAVIGPQFVYLEVLVPGLLYIMIALLSFISIMCIISLPETNHRMLVDRLVDDLDRERKQEKDHMDSH